MVDRCGRHLSAERDARSSRRPPVGEQVIVTLSSATRPTLRAVAVASRAAVLALLVLVLAGCQVRVATDIDVAADGSGTVSVRIVVDDELRDTLDEAGIDLAEGLDEAASGASWTARALDGSDDTGVELTTTFATPDELGAKIAALSAGLTEDDGALLRDAKLERTEDGGYAFTVAAGLDPPAIVGSLPTDPDAAVRFDGDDLARAMAEAGDELARADLRVTFPTVPAVPEDQGATVNATAVSWSLPVDGLAVVSAVAPPVPLALSTGLLIASPVAGLLIGAFAVRAFRRR